MKNIKKIDIIYVLKKDNHDNFELRYSLRSLTNIKGVKINNVYIIWYKPDWIKNIIHIPYNDDVKWFNVNHKFNNVRNKYRLIIENNEISDDFLFMNDDFYFLKPQEIEYYKMWLLYNQLEYLKRIWSKNEYFNTINHLFELFPWKDSFETHTPILYNKQKLKKLLEKYEEIKGFRTTYCNEYNIKGKELISARYISENKLNDCKVYNIDNFDIIKWQKLLSSADNLWIYFQYFLQEYFKDFSIYENSEFERIVLKNMVKVKLNISCLYGNVWEIAEIDEDRVKNMWNDVEVIEFVKSKKLDIVLKLI